MAFDPLTGIMEIGGKLIDKLLPDPEAKAKANLELAKLAEKGEFDGLKLQMSAIIAEANSSDPWTSRARPSFLYVMYVMILAAVPMGFLMAYNPLVAKDVIAGMKDWLAAIPDPMWALFGTGYLGYTAAREVGKHSKNKWGK